MDIRRGPVSQIPSNQLEKLCMNILHIYISQNVKNERNFSPSALGKTAGARRGKPPAQKQQCVKTTEDATILHLSANCMYCCVFMHNVDQPAADSVTKRVSVQMCKKQ